MDMWMFCSNDMVKTRGVARGYFHDPRQDRKNELDPSFRRFDPLNYKILILFVQCPFQALFISLVMQTYTSKILHECSYTVVVQNLYARAPMYTNKEKVQ